eukprot:1706240-Pleurochrysis_carterae.AAC.2
MYVLHTAQPGSQPWSTHDRWRVRIATRLSSLPRQLCLRRRLPRDMQYTHELLSRGRSARRGLPTAAHPRGRSARVVVTAPPASFKPNTVLARDFV